MWLLQLGQNMAPTGLRESLLQDQLLVFYAKRVKLFILGYILLLTLRYRTDFLFIRTLIRTF